MADLEEQVRRWLASCGVAPPPVELLRVEEGGAAVLAFLKGTDRVATVALTPIEGSSFFAEGQEEPSEEVEDWLTEANSHLSERPRLTLGEALSSLWARAPRAWRTSGEEESDEPAELEGESDEHEMEEDLVVPEVEAAEERAAKRAAYAEERHWGALASAAAARGSRQASQVLMREMRALLALEGDGAAKALEIEMVEDSLYHWSVKMHADGFPEACPLKGDLQKFAAQHPSRIAAVIMDVVFPDSFPMDPPFIRVVRPRFQMHTGHITIGGSVCMQLLTPSGWLPSVSLENVFVSIRSEMTEGGGRIDFASGARDYSVSEAKEAFKRVAERYGWQGRS